MRSVTLPVLPTNVQVVLASIESRPAKIYVEGVAFADREPVKDEKNRELQKFDALVAISGIMLGTVTVESPTGLPESIPLGAIFQPQGTCLLRVSIAQDGFNLKTVLRIEGLEPARKP
jgi:hypothetical protein